MPADGQPGTARFFHGTSARIEPGGVIEPGHSPNFPVDELTYPDPGKDVFFTSAARKARTYADRVWARAPSGRRPRAYQVEPTGDYQPHGGDDVFRSSSPLRVTREI
jgi:hypothetical protein